MLNTRPKHGFNYTILPRDQRALSVFCISCWELSPCSSRWWLRLLWTLQWVVIPVLMPCICEMDILQWWCYMWTFCEYQSNICDIVEITFAGNVTSTYFCSLTCCEQNLFERSPDLHILLVCIPVIASSVCVYLSSQYLYYRRRPCCKKQC